MRASHATPAEIILGKALAPLSAYGVQLSVLLVAGSALFALPVNGSALAISVVALAFSLCLVGWGLALVSVCRTLVQLNAVTGLGPCSCQESAAHSCPSTSSPAGSRQSLP